MKIASILLMVIYILTFLTGIAVIFIEHKDPTATLAWLLMLYTLPGLGLILYLLLSQNISRYRIKLSNFDNYTDTEGISSQREEIADGSFAYINQEAAKWRQLIRQNQSCGACYLTQDNKTEIIVKPEDMFGRLCEDLENAKHTINIEYYIIKSDSTGERILDILEKKAVSGVRIRLLLDDVGCRRLNKRRIRKLRRLGVKVVFFFPAILFRFNLRLNYRNHRKIAVIDNKTAYIGGFNIGDEYAGLSEKFGAWRDTHLRIEGGAVEDIEARFVLDWKFASKEDYKIARKMYNNPVEPGNSGIQIVSSGPDNREQEIKLAFLRMITGAKRRIYLQTPYFVPDQSIYEALKTAALAGLDVRVMIPSMPDHPFVYWVSYFNAGHLLDYGVKVYTYQPGFLHSKMITVDEEVSSIGSANLDIRSFKLNFECNAVVYDKEIARQLEDAFDADIQLSERLTKEKYAARPRSVRFKESVSRLISDIL